MANRALAACQKLPAFFPLDDDVSGAWAAPCAWTAPHQSSAARETGPARSPRDDSRIDVLRSCQNPRFSAVTEPTQDVFTDLPGQGRRTIAALLERPRPARCAARQIRDNGLGSLRAAAVPRSSG